MTPVSGMHHHNSHRKVDTLSAEISLTENSFDSDSDGQNVNPHGAILSLTLGKLQHCSQKIKKKTSSTRQTIYSANILFLSFLIKRFSYKIYFVIPHILYILSL